MINVLDAAPPPRPPVGLLRGASLFLDFDGTLVDIAPRPDAVHVSTALRDLLGKLDSCLGGRVAILSGRPADEVDQLLRPLTVVIGGHHGLETRRDGSTERGERPASLDALLERFRRLARAHPGVIVEDKPLGIALHFRQAPEAEDACRQAVEDAAAESGLLVQPGKMVFELRPGGSDKGSALRALMDRAPFSAGVPIFVGDDLTDEPAFAAASAMGGAGILVGDRTDTAAGFRLDTVSEAMDWLAAACEAGQ